MVFGGLLAVFFLGGWRGPFLPPLVWLLIKMALAAIFMIWVRGTLPRLRYDQLMGPGMEGPYTAGPGKYRGDGVRWDCPTCFPEGAFTQPCMVVRRAGGENQ